MFQYPSFYDPNKVGTLFLTRNTEVAAAGVKYAHDNDVRPAREDQQGERVVLTIVDGQIDFIFPDGALPVPGAVADTRRTIEWIYRNVEKITSIQLSLDTHVPYQIFSPLWWADRITKAMPAPMTTIINASNYGKRYTPKFVPDFDPNWNRTYIDQLKSAGNKDLLLWTLHCQLGTPGYAIEPSLYEAVLFWAAAREANPVFLTKGDDLYTEMYAIEMAEVPNPTNANTMLNTAFLTTLSEFDKIYIVGQAKSHCVFATVDVAVKVFAAQASHVLPRIHLMMDAMSSVGAIYAPDGSLIVDFEAMVQPVYEQWESQYGLVLDSTTSDL